MPKITVICRKETRFLGYFPKPPEGISPAKFVPDRAIKPLKTDALDNAKSPGWSR